MDPQFEALISPGSHPALPEGFPSGRVILTVGRWLATERYKGMDTLITALPRLLTQRPEVQLVVAGAVCVRARGGGPCGGEEGRRARPGFVCGGMVPVEGGLRALRSAVLG